MFKNTKSTKWTALLVALVLVTSLFVGGAIARYITSTSSEDSARVAVWGINEAGTTMDLFENEYTIDGSGELKAKSADDDDIIAPGLNGASPFKIVNTSTLKPEVMYEIAISLDDSKIADEIKNHPGIEWKVDNGEWGTWEEFKTELLSLSGDASGVKTYAPLDVNHEFANGKTHTVAWQWIMDSGYDEEDTAMGNYVATTGDITAKLSITVTARQTDVDSTGMLAGNGSVYNTLNPQPLVFRSAAPADELVEVKVGDDTLTKNDDYTVGSGSTIITLTDSYLENLEVGKYTISIISNNMTAKANFTVEENTTIVHTGIIPEGGIYYTENLICDGEYGTDRYSHVNDYSAAKEILTTGDTFPSPKQGDTYVYGDYEYRYEMYISPEQLFDPTAWFAYNTPIGGWTVRAKDLTKTNYGNILTTIGSANVVSMMSTFERAANMIEAPEIPNTITDMSFAFAGTKLSIAPEIPNGVKILDGAFAETLITTTPIIPNSITSLWRTFQNCERLTTVTNIPQSVKSIEMTFMACTNLTGEIEIHEKISSFYNAFACTEKPIVLTGTNPKLEEIAQTAENGNVTVAQ